VLTPTNRRRNLKLLISAPVFLVCGALIVGVVASAAGWRTRVVLPSEWGNYEMDYDGVSSVRIERTIGFVRFTHSGTVRRGKVAPAGFR
jgi:hypothetical protein